MRDTEHGVEYPGSMRGAKEISKRHWRKPGTGGKKRNSENSTLVSDSEEAAVYPTNRQLDMVKGDGGDRQY